MACGRVAPCAPTTLSLPRPQPHVMRVAPVPLYNTFADVAAFCVALKEALDEVSAASA